MPIHIEEMTTDITLMDGELPLTEAQVEVLVARVLARLREQEKADQYMRETTAIRRRAVPASPFAE
jgi:hypothetical protein